MELFNESEMQHIETLKKEIKLIVLEKLESETRDESML